MTKKSNLNPPIQSTDEAREKGRAGGIASGKARRDKRIMRDALEKELGTDLPNITKALLKRALSGDVRAYEVIRDTLGEKPTDKITFTGGIDSDDADELENEIKSLSRKDRKTKSRA